MWPPTGTVKMLSEDVLAASLGVTSTENAIAIGAFGQAATAGGMPGVGACSEKDRIKKRLFVSTLSQHFSGVKVRGSVGRPAFSYQSSPRGTPPPVQLCPNQSDASGWTLKLSSTRAAAPFFPTTLSATS